ncbi:MAG TPA: methyltransferase domain-containing protein [Terriglobales bacterium]|nr:methyltransferase domain-containing protein [Terriglobales bacterium]
MPTPDRIRRRWNDKYAAPEAPPWEQIPLDDLAQFLTLCRVRNVRRLLDVGCGTGLRLLGALLCLGSLNRKDVTVLGIDLSPLAVKTAGRYLDAIQSGSPPSQLVSLGISPERRLDCGVTFREEDSTSEEVDLSGPFDLAIDWMCLHEVWDPIDHARRIASWCSALFVLNAFSENNDWANVTRAVEGVDKRRYSLEDVRGLFGRWFDIHFYHEFPARPDLKQSDGPLLAKRAYLMIRRDEDS